MYGYGAEIKNSGNDFFAHKTGFTQKSLSKALQLARFKSILCIAADLEIKAIAFKKPLCANTVEALKNNPVLHLGNLYLQQGYTAQAETCYRYLLYFYPDDVDLNINMGFVLIELDQYDEAESYLLRSVSFDREKADAHYLLGLIHQKKGNIKESVEYCQLALNTNSAMDVALDLLYQIYVGYPQFPLAKQILIDKAKNGFESTAAQYYAGCIYLADNNLDIAIDFFNKALRRDTGNELIYLQLGIAYNKQQKIDLAIETYQKVIEINKNNIVANNNLGCIFQGQGKIEEAIYFFKSVIDIDPNNAEAHHNMGSMLYKKNEKKMALIEYKKAIDINPELADAHVNMAKACYELSRYDDAMMHYKKVLELKGDNGVIVNDIGVVLRHLGKEEDAIAHYRYAISIAEDDKILNMAYSNLLFSLSYHDKYSAEQYLQEAKVFGETVLAKTVSYCDWLVSRNQNRPLRVGLVSGDLCKHPVGFFLENMMNHIDPQRLLLLVYSMVSVEDELTKKLKQNCVSWLDISSLSDDVAAQQIREHQVDVLIDLSGHTGGNRLALFARKPAPVQVTWLGYWASIGLTTIDYVLTDEVSLPASHQNQFMEKAWYLPNTRLCLSLPHEPVEVSALPAQSNGYVTFGSFQSMTKITDEVLLLWSRVLNSIPDARLRLQNKQLNNESMRLALSARIEKVGIKLERVTLLANMPIHRAYFEAHQEVDIILDTFPYPGITTTCEALWMGVPTVTLPKNSMNSRAGCMLLTCAGLQEWIANTEEEYINIAINKASDISTLAQLRAGLREQVRTSPLFDAELFARNFETAMFGMWKEKMSSLPQDKIT
jgi:predicted O-linked N-acetylglucosamine transferase (SPINDLY family)